MNLDDPRDPDTWYVFGFRPYGELWSLLDRSDDEMIARTMFATRVAQQRNPLRFYRGHELIAERGVVSK